MYWNALRIKLLVWVLLAVSGQVSGYEGESVDEGFLASCAHPHNHNHNPLEQTEPKSSWNVVAFQSMDERHKCQLSLDDDGLGQYGIQQVGDLVWLSIPDQGIKGVYAVTDIRSLKPPKIPSGEDIDGEAGYSYITGIFAHTSDDVWKLTFDKGDTIEVTSSHPFLTVDGLWTAAATLNPGDKVQTKDGICVLVDKDQLEGEHTVYNITVSGTHNYLVGQEGLVVHNSCGKIDLLVKKFKDHVDPAIKLKEITEWWAKGAPEPGKYLDSFFGRGRFFEKLMRQSKFKDWEWTGDISSTFPGIDIYRVVGGKNIVASLKTSNESPTAWLARPHNKKHLGDLVKGMKDKQFAQSAQKVVKANEVQLIIAVPQNKLSEFANFEAQVHALKSQYPGLEKIKVEVVTIENALNL